MHFCKLFKEDLIQKVKRSSVSLMSVTLIPVQMKSNHFLVKVIHDQSKKNVGVLRAVFRVHLGYSVSNL